MNAPTDLKFIHFTDLPDLGAALEGGKFLGLTTKKDGSHCAVVLLPNKGDEFIWKAAKAWAEEQGGELPTRPVAALLYANVKDQLKPEWHWTADEEGASSAWGCTFSFGYQGYGHKSYEGYAVAFRRVLPL